VDDTQRHVPQTSRSPSAPTESLASAEYQEWPFQALVKRATIGSETTYNLKFQLPRIPDYLHFPILSEMLSTGCIMRPPGKAAVSYYAVMPRKPRKELMEKQESLLAKMVRGDKTWAEIERQFPNQALQSLKENLV
jgi:hypothetical protein